MVFPAYYAVHGLIGSSAGEDQRRDQNVGVEDDPHCSKYFSRSLWVRMPFATACSDQYP